VDLRHIPVLKAELHEAKHTVEGMTAEARKIKAESQIMEKKMRNMESENEAIRYLKREKQLFKNRTYN
jgi:cell division protein FtsB